jgi:hypothetical protein
MRPAAAIAALECAASFHSRLALPRRMNPNGIFFFIQILLLTSYLLGFQDFEAGNA